jgi:acrylyl-CoA reductase (NADPH)
VDCVGGPTLAAVLRTLRYGAAVAASGLTGGNALETTVYPFIVRNVALLGVDTVRTPMDERRAVWESMATAWSPDLLDGMVDDEVGLDQLAPAIDRILAGRVRGRVLVRPCPSA